MPRCLRWFSASATGSGGPAERTPFRPPFTTAILALNILVFAAMVFTWRVSHGTARHSASQVGRGLRPFTLGGQPWRVLSSTYVHIGLWHLAVNMWSLWQLGRLAERIFGEWAYALVYTATGIAASLTSLWWNPMRISAGASGALFGIVGALISALYLGKLPFPKPVVQRILKNLVMVVVVNLLFGASRGLHRQLCAHRRADCRTGDRRGAGAASESATRTATGPGADDLHGGCPLPDWFRCIREATQRMGRREVSPIAAVCAAGRLDDLTRQSKARRRARPRPHDKIINVPSAHAGNVACRGRWKIVGP